MWGVLVRGVKTIDEACGEKVGTYLAIKYLKIMY